MEEESHRGPQLCFGGTTAEFSSSRWLKMRERSELLQLNFQGYPLFKQVLKNDKSSVTSLTEGKEEENMSAHTS